MSDDVKEIAVSGFADATRKNPIAYALVLEALAIAFLTWMLLSDQKVERDRNAQYIKELHEQLVLCHDRR